MEARQKLQDRNKRIYADYLSGTNMEAL